MDSYFDYFDCHDNLIMMDTFYGFFDVYKSPVFQCKYHSSLPPFLWITLMILLTLVDPPFIQYTPLPGLPLLVANSTLDPIQYVRIT